MGVSEQLGWVEAWLALNVTEHYEATRLLEIGSRYLAHQGVCPGWGDAFLHR